MTNPNSLQPGQKVGAGRFVLVQPLGRGGMGEVWLAQDERLGEPVALKFLPPEVRADPAALDDLRRETARSHRLTHPNIVRIHDLHEEPGGLAFIAMEYVDGPTLAGLRLEQPGRVLSWEFLCPLVQQLCAALDYAHGEKVIHRDLKPANVMVDSKGRLKLADFGIAATVSDSVSRVSGRLGTSGTLPYMSPQQLAGKHPQTADDIYALGATLYELLTSKPPFYTGDITHQVLRETPEPLPERLAALEINNEVPPDVAAIVMACLAKETAQRPQSARAVAEWVGLEVVSKPSIESLAGTVFSSVPAREASPGASDLPAAAPAAVSRSKAVWAGSVAFILLALLAAGGWRWTTRESAGKRLSALAKAASEEPPEVPASLPPVASLPKPVDARVKNRWSKALNDAIRDLQNNNDQESANFVSSILTSLEQPSGLSPAVLADDLEHIKSRVRDLVRAGAMESAAALNCLQVKVSYTPNFAEPAQPNHKSGAMPGPGGLVLYLPFDKPDDNGVVHDESGAGNDGLVYGAQWVSDGKFGAAYHFNQTNFTDRIVIPNSDLLNPDYITAAAWIKATASAGFWNRIMDKDCWHGYSLSLGGDSIGNKGKTERGKLRFEGQVSIGAASALNDNLWHHVAAAFDGQTVRCYVDGVESSRRVRNSGLLHKTTWDLCIGNSVVGYGTGELLAFDGMIDEVRIYDRALSAAEIKALAKAKGVPGNLQPLVTLATTAPATLSADASAGRWTNGSANTLILQLGHDSTMALKFIPAGTFSMGSRESDPMKRPADTPQHEVILGEPFYIGATEVTRWQFEAFVSQTAYQTDAEKRGWGTYYNGGNAKRLPGRNWRNPGYEVGPEHPVACLTWGDAKRFCEWLSTKTGRTLRLPTEAEWEYACRAGTTTTYHWGDNPAGGEGWCNVSDQTLKDAIATGPRVPGINSKGECHWRDGYAFTAPASRFRSNAWGLFDMHGNVWEWCADWYQPDYHPRAGHVDPQGPASGSQRVIRGGCFDEEPSQFRSASRVGIKPDEADFGVGFRVVMQVEGLNH